MKRFGIIGLPLAGKTTVFNALTGLRHRLGPVRAVLACGLMFGLFHLSPARIPVTGILGVVLAVLALRGDSILPAMLCHALYNGLLVGAEELVPTRLLAASGGGIYDPLVLGAAALLVGAGIWLLLADDAPDDVEIPGARAHFS